MAIWLISKRVNPPLNDPPQSKAQRPAGSITSSGGLRPVYSSSTSSTIVCAAAGATSRRSSALQRLGREYDISPTLVGEAAVYDHINLTDEMASRFAPVPRWRHGEDYLALLDCLGPEAAEGHRILREGIKNTIEEIWGGSNDEAAVIHKFGYARVNLKARAALLKVSRRQ